MNRSLVAALALMAGSSAAVAQTVPAPPVQPVPPPASVKSPPIYVPAPAPSAPVEPNKDVSAFVKCDGSKGHAGILAVMGQLVAITATAGLSGALTNDNGSVKDRLSGADGVAACDSAIRQEKNPARLTQLAVARTVHQLEQNNLDAALASVREIPSLVGPMADDPGYRQSYGSATRILEANILVRMGRLAEAEQVALSSSAAAPYEIVAGLRADHFLNLTSTLSDAKRAHFDRMAKLSPESLMQYSYTLAAIGDYRAAAAKVDDFSNLAQAFYPDARRQLHQATSAVYLAMAGDMPASNQIAEKAAQSLADFAATPDAAKEANFIASTDEWLAFQRVARFFAEGDAAKARIAFTARDRWTFVPIPVVADLVARLRTGAKPAELTGVLAQDPAVMRTAALANLAKSFTTDKAAVSRLYGSLGYEMKTGVLASAGGSAWKVGAKPRYLLRKDAGDTTPYETVDVAPLAGLESGEALLLHAALIAKTRGKQGFVLMPIRKVLVWSRILFVNPGEGGTPTDCFLDADQVIADLSPTMPNPALAH